MEAKLKKFLKSFPEEKCWCAICKYEPEAKTFNELIDMWTKHIKSERHTSTINYYIANCIYLLHLNSTRGVASI
jgi:hypothetical protein